MIRCPVSGAASVRCSARVLTQLLSGEELRDCDVTGEGKGWWSDGWSEGWSNKHESEWRIWLEAEAATDVFVQILQRILSTQTPFLLH